MAPSAALDIVEPSTQFLDAQSHVWRQVFNYVSSMSLKCATELGIPDAVHKHGRPITLAELVSALNISSDKAADIGRLMRVLIRSGFFKTARTSPDGEEGYALTPSSLILVEDHEFSLKPFVMFQVHPHIIDPLYCLAKWFRNDLDTVSQTAFGISSWDKKENEPEFSRAFDAAMACDTPLLCWSIVKDCKHVFDGLKSLVDVGGGTGTLAKAVADIFPRIECTVLDLPYVVEGLKDTPNLKYVGGDMFHHIPPADAILMKWILHDWDDKTSVQILKNCKKAVTPKGGKVILIEMVVEDPTTNIMDVECDTHIFLDLVMMALVRGKERTEKEWAKLFSDAGFSTYKITRISKIKSVIEVFP